MMDCVWPVFSWEQFFGECEERLGILRKVCDVKYGHGLRDLVLLEVVIETSPWAPTMKGILIIICTSYMHDL